MNIALGSIMFAALAALTINGAQAQKKGAPPAKPAAVPANPQYVISVMQGGAKLGDITIELYPDAAPKHCANFDSLVAIKFYDGTAFHRVIPDFMIQGGDPNTRGGSPNTWGSGDPTQKRVPAEFSQTLSHVRGIISAARTNDPNSATSQFFICVGNPTYLDKQYSIFGKVLNGMEIADKIAKTPRGENDRPNEKVTMTIKKLGGKPEQPVAAADKKPAAKKPAKKKSTTK